MSVENKFTKSQRVFGDTKIRRTPEQIVADKKRQSKHDHIAFTMDRNLKYKAVDIKNRLADEKKLDKGKTENTAQRLLMLEDMIPQYSLHKTTV